MLQHTLSSISDKTSTTVTLSGIFGFSLNNFVDRAKIEKPQVEEFSRDKKRSSDTLMEEVKLVVIKNVDSECAASSKFSTFCAFSFTIGIPIN